MKVIPAIDLQDGKCVRLYQGDFTKRTEYSDDPVGIARQFSALAVTDLHIVDLDGARSGSQSNRELVAAIAADSELTLQLGGGIRSAETLSTWLDSGVARCVIGSLAITEPDMVKAWIARFGADRIVLALDVHVDRSGLAKITTHGWTRESDTTLFECIDDFTSAGLRRVLCTDVGRDGAMTGPNLGLYQSILRRYPGLELQASGGVRGLADLEALRGLGVPAAITGRALLDGKITAREIESFQRNE
jgi:phosphoribosylformimino-5-aminoimidazole carboxamide ribotide isomerase